MKNKNKTCFLFFLFLPLLIWAVFVSIKTARCASSSFFINEVLINGTTGEEFIELYNPTDANISLKNHYLAYYSSGRDWPNPYRNKKFPDTAEIKSKTFYLIVIKTGDLPTAVADWNLTYSSHQLSDSNGSLVIFPDNIFAESNAISAISWGNVDFVEKGKELIVPKAGKSLEKKSLGWQKSAEENGSPGKENSPWTEKSEKTELVSEDFSIKKDANIYKNIYANFEVDYPAATSATKYTWNFGDGHKSYLEKTRHKYEAIGTYQASLTLRGDKKAVKNFEVRVEEFKSPKIKIVRISPNPKGKDTKNEWIEIKNDSKKKINLKDWIVATGWDKLINHKITKKFVLKSKESAKLTSQFCAFTLNNKKNKLELRSPDGETVQKIKYNRKDGTIQEDETYQQVGKNWEWSAPIEVSDEKEETQKETEPEIQTPAPEAESPLEEKQEEIQIDESEIQASLGKFSENPFFVEKRKNRDKFLSFGSKIKTPASLLESQGKVAGAYWEKEIPPEKHWAENISENAWKKINLSLNKLFW